MLKLNLKYSKNLHNHLLSCLVKWNYDYNEVFYGSMPAKTLEKLTEYASGNGLQIGGFVGVTHVYLAKFLENKGTLCTIDINVPHRGINNPALVMYNLAKKFQVTNNSTIIIGDSIIQMRIMIQQNLKFDFILLDGNHDYDIVQKEIMLADKLLKQNGILILDDIDHWSGPRSIYENFPLPYEKIPLDNRAGVLKKI